MLTIDTVRYTLHEVRTKWSECIHQKVLLIRLLTKQVVVCSLSVLCGVLYTSYRQYVAGTCTKHETGTYRPGSEKR